MRHLKAGRKLGRNATHRLAMRRNLAYAIFSHERIITTLPKAKDLRPFVEKLITLAKRGTLHARRQAAMILGPTASAEVMDKKDKGTGVTLLQHLFKEMGPRFATRPGGYTRIIRRHEVRLGDAGSTAYIELLKADEEKAFRKSSKAPAPTPIAPAPQPALEPAPAVEPEMTNTAEPVSEAPAPESATPETPAPQQPKAE